MPDQSNRAKGAGASRGWRWLIVTTAVLVVLVLGGIALVNGVLLPRLTAMLDSAVRRELSLPAEAKVDIRLGSVAQTAKGYLPAFHVESPSAVIDEIAFEWLRFDAADVDFNMRRIIQGDKAEITAVGSARLTLRISADQLRARLVPLIEAEGLEQVQVDFEPGAVKVTAKRKVKFIGKVKLAARGRLIVADGTRVRLQVTDVETGQFNIGVSKLGIEFIEALPALDLGGMFAEIVIDELNVTHDYLRITAHTEGIAGDEVPAETIDVF